MKNFSDQFMAKPGLKHKVKDFKSDFTGGLDKEDGIGLLQENINLLIDLQDKFYAYNKYSLLIVFQAMDAAGKDGTIKHVMSGVNPQGCQVFTFKQPSSEELDHDYMWRIYKCLPERGRIGIFNRSHYEEVLITKVHPEILLNEQLPDIKTINDADEDFWQKRYQQINNFEKHLYENGTIILKFFLNVSQEEQEKRFLKRLEDESKLWKFSLSDMKERTYWDQYMKAFSDMITQTSTEYAPWYIIPADHKWFMRYAVGKIITDKLEKLKVKYPILSKEERKKLEEIRDELTKKKDQKEKH